jgi:hypothetical protein
VRVCGSPDTSMKRAHFRDIAAPAWTSQSAIAARSRCARAKRACVPLSGFLRIDCRPHDPLDAEWSIPAATRPVDELSHGWYGYIALFLGSSRSYSFLTTA